MSQTLNLIDRLLTLGRNFQKFQCDREALNVFGRLAAFQELPSAVAEETQVRLAEIHLRRRRHKRARRHLTIALLHRPDSARSHYLMATALDRKAGNLERAAAHYRKSLEFDPKQPACLAALGLVLLRRGLVAQGLDRLREAATLAPNDPAVIGKLVKGLCLAEGCEEALQVLRAARFRNPREGRFTRLYNDTMFRQLRRQQRVERRAVPAEDGPTLLPFFRLATERGPASSAGKVIRIDPPAPLAGPHLPHRPLRRSDWKHG